MHQQPKIIRTPDRSAHRFVLSGRPGIGKTFFVSTIPDVFIIPIEEGLKGASPDHAPAHFDRLPSSIAELHKYLDLFAEAAPQAGFRHLALDSLSGIEALVHKAACGQEQVVHMEAKDFKKVWAAAVPIWRRLQQHLDAIRRTGVHVWLVAHGAEVTEADAATGEQWKRWDVAFQGSGASVGEVRGMWRQWTDHVLFIDWVVKVSKGSIGRRATARYDARVLHTRESPTHFAKTRSPLPPTIAATWPDLSAALKRGAAAPVASLRAKVDEVLEQLEGAAADSVRADLKAAKTASAVAAVLSRAEGLAALAATDESFEADEPAPPDSVPPPADTEPGQAEPTMPPPEAAAPPAQATPPEQAPVDHVAGLRKDLDAVTTADEARSVTKIAEASKLLGPDQVAELKEAAYARLIDLTPREELPALAREIADVGFAADRAGRLKQAYLARKSQNGAPAVAAEASL